MELKHYTENEIIEIIEQSPEDLNHIVFYPDTIFDLFREITFLEDKLDKRISKDEPFNLIKQSYAGFTKGFSSFMEFRKNAYSVAYDANNFDSLQDLIGNLISKQAITPLSTEDKQKFSIIYKPFANRDILLLDDEFKEISRTLKINFEKQYKVIFSRIDVEALKQEVETDKKYPKEIDFKPLEEVGELTLYPDGHIYENEKRIHQIDKHQGDFFDFMRFLMKKQSQIGQKLTTKQDVKTFFKGREITNILNNSNKPFLKAKSKFAIKRNKQGYVWIGYSNKWIEDTLKE